MIKHKLTHKVPLVINLVNTKVFLKLQTEKFRKIPRSSLLETKLTCKIYADLLIIGLSEERFLCFKRICG